jgi:hypothetical protein
VNHYAGLDVSLKLTSVCVVDEKGKIVRESKVESEAGALPETVDSRTPRGGRHIWFKGPGDRVPNSASKIGNGLDIRGDGGYVIVPPSKNAAGETYCWIHEPDVTVLADMPKWLLRLAVAPKSTEKGHPGGTYRHNRSVSPAADDLLRNEAETVAATGDGARNDALNRAAFKLGYYITLGIFSEDDVLAALLLAAERNGCVSDDGEAAARTTIASGMSAGKATAPDMGDLLRLAKEDPYIVFEREHQRVLSHLAYMIGMAVQFARSAGTEVEAELGGDDDIPPEGRQSLANQFFVRERAIDLSGVEKSDAALDRSSDERDHIVLICGRTAVVIHSHAAQSNGRDFDVAKFAFLHWSLLRPPGPSKGRWMRMRALLHMSWAVEHALGIRGATACD